MTRASVAAARMSPAGMSTAEVSSAGVATAEMTAAKMTASAKAVLFGHFGHLAAAKSSSPESLRCAAAAKEAVGSAAAIAIRVVSPPEEVEPARTPLFSE